MASCRSPSKTGGSFPWSGPSSTPIGFGFCRSCGGGPGGGARGGGPPNSFCEGFGFGVVIPNRLCIGRDHVSLRLTEGVAFSGPIGGAGAAIVRILLRVWS